MNTGHSRCVILADRHWVLTEGIRGLLESTFQTVYAVADAPSLKEGALRLSPVLIVLDLSLVGSDSLHLLEEIRETSPATPVIVLSVHDQAAVAQLALASGARGVVIKRSIGSDLLPAIDAVLNDEEYVSPDFNLLAATH